MINLDISEYQQSFYIDEDNQLRWKWDKEKEPEWNTRFANQLVGAKDGRFKWKGHRWNVSDMVEKLQHYSYTWGFTFTK